jgi:hypothetical protein
MSSRFDPLARLQEEFLVRDLRLFWPWCFGFVQDFYCKDGKAYLFDKVQVTCSPPVPRFNLFAI